VNPSEVRSSSLSADARSASLRALLRGVTWRDLRVAAVVAVVQIGGTVGAAAHQHSHRHASCWWAASCNLPRQLGPLAFVLLACGPVALIVRRRYPRAVFVFVFGVTLLYVALGYPQGPVYLSLVVAFASAVFAGHRLLTRLSIIVGWALFLWLAPALGTADAPQLLAVVALAAWLIVLLVVCEAVRGRRERMVEARRQRELAARRRADEERLRIARELHDVLAHNVSLINVQAGVALHLLQNGDAEPKQVEPALAAIKQASAETLREMRSVLGTLRQADEAAPRAPEPGLGNLEALVGRMRDAGVEVELTFSGERRELPGSVDLAAYRIAQEALTNVARHAPGRPARVEIAFDDQGVTVTVENPTGGGVAGEPVAGNGIVGMRERATALGGTLEARRGGDGVFKVRAWLPAAVTEAGE
jgi:signal transduction histidine kinase